MSSVKDLSPEDQAKVKKIAAGLAKDLAPSIHTAAHQLHEAVEELQNGGDPEDFMATVLGTQIAIGLVVKAADIEAYKRMKAAGVELPDEVEAQVKALGGYDEPEEYKNEPGKRPRIVMPLGKA